MKTETHLINVTWQRCLLLWRKAMTNLDRVLKSRDITLPTKVRLVKAMVFPVVMYECENQTIKEAEHWRIDAFELWCLRRFVEIKLVNPKENQPWIFIGRTDAKAPILWPPDAKSWLNGKDPDAGKDWGQEEKQVTEDEMVGWYHSMDVSLSRLWEILKDREAWVLQSTWLQRVRHNLATGQQ